MKAAFMVSGADPRFPSDATAWHSALPRTARLTLRLTTPKKQSDNSRGTDLLNHFRTEYQRDDYHAQNHEMMCRDYSDDEFADADNEYEGLTIVEAMSEAELFEFCTGYNVL